MPVELNIIESVTELDTTVVTLVLESASEPGPAGPGVPTGGTAGQVLTKDSGTDYDTSWQDASGGPGAVDAEDVAFTAAGTISATDVQAAVEEVASDAATALSTHEADSTNVHGITDTAALALSANVPSNSTFNDHSARHENGGADEINIGGLDGTPTELTNHLNDTSAAHAASAISADSTTLVGTGTDVQAVLEELDNGIADHLADSSAAHAASAISFTPNGSIAATDVQAAIQEVRDEAGGGGAPTDATYITQTANGTLSNEQALSALSTGIVKVTTTTGVLSTAVANTDYPAVTHASRHENGGADEISLAGLSGDPADTVNKSLYDANTVLAATSDNTPAAVTMGASTFLARLAAGDIKAASVAEVQALIGGEYLIQEITVPSGGSATVDFTSIPGTYRHLKIVGRCRSENAAAQNFMARFNGDTGSNYAATAVRSISGTAGAFDVSGQTAMEIGIISDTSEPYPLVIEVDVPYYATGTEVRQMLARSGVRDPRGIPCLALGSWNGTGAVTRVTFHVNGGSDIKEGSIFSLYGVY